MNVSICQFSVAMTVLVCVAVASCTSAYTVAQQKLASGDYQGAEQALGSRTDEKAERIRAQIREQGGQSEVVADLRSATKALESGQYATARDNYNSASESSYVTDVQKREALDGICIAERKAGEPSYSIETQYQDCLEASNQPGSATAPLLTRLAIQLKTDYGRSIDAAIAAKDDSKAEALLEKYKTLSDTDPTQISEWEKQIQLIKETRSRLEKKLETERAKDAISRLERRYPEMRKLTQEQFEDFIIKNYMVESAPFFTDARVDGNSLQVVAPNPNIQTIMSSQATLDEINDYFVAWCRCKGQTHVIGDYYGRRVGLATVNLSVEDQHSYVTIGR